MSSVGYYKRLYGPKQLDTVGEYILYENRTVARCIEILMNGPSKGKCVKDYIKKMKALPVRRTNTRNI